MNLKKKKNLNYWLRKIYTSKIYQFFYPNDLVLKKKVFTTIYKSNHWAQSDNLPGEKVSVSGPGSNVNMDGFINLKKNIDNFIENYEIKSILDMPCGDFLWLNEIIKEKKINYLGIDIVDELIVENRKNYQNTNTFFECYDIINYIPSKQFDLILIRDLFIHLKNSDIHKIIDNLKKIDFKYVALNSSNNKINIDGTIGQHRKVNLLIEPFNLKKPSLVINDGEKDKFIYIFKKEDII
jgi:SAM-dependent methyltransferase